MNKELALSQFYSEMNEIVEAESLSRDYASEKELYEANFDLDLTALYLLGKKFGYNPDYIKLSVTRMIKDHMRDKARKSKYQIILSQFDNDRSSIVFGARDKFFQNDNFIKLSMRKYN